MQTFLNWLVHVLGLDNLSGPFYGWWSGPGSDLTQLAILGGLIQFYRRHNCHVKGCWRLQWKAVPGTDHIVCRKHHPSNPPTAQQVLDDHRNANES